MHVMRPLEGSWRAPACLYKRGHCAREVGKSEHIEQKAKSGKTQAWKSSWREQEQNPEHMHYLNSSLESF